MTQIAAAAASREPQLAVGVLRAVIRALVETGHDHRSLLAAEGLTAADFENPEARIPHAVALRVLAAAVEATGDPAFGMTSAAYSDLGDMGIMGQLLMTAPSVRAAIARVDRFARLLHDRAECAHERRGDLFYWQLRLHGVEMSVAATEGLAASTIARLRVRLGPDWSPREMWFPYPAPPHRAVYERFFRCPVHFEMPALGTVFEAAILELVNPIDSAISELIERRAEAALQRLDGEPRCTERVREVLLAGLPRGEIGADAVTRALHMSRATLTRRLAAEGTTLSTVLDGLRRDIALEYVREPAISIEELAKRLAFSDARALRRAFVRWTGKTPAELRAERS